MTDTLGDILVCDFEVKRNLYNKWNIEIRISVNDIHSFKCSEDQTLAEILALKITDITLKRKDDNEFTAEEETNKKDGFQLLMDSARASNTPKKRAENNGI